ncbi:hypothetical protein RchiOBHm_Chr5g0065731 [Rosa chinensis]|uniref:Uncharacterized protein n=1 Tax=Rosa chinensis TaxID=74649 RepID=A0A2P6QJ12_ROSCH|nr:hypothetical protein RchiOBHm_Chr5g0065731 [Rosa chinensis]
MLMEEELENRPCMLQDCLALQAAEKSLEDVLVQQYPPSTNPVLASSIQQNVENSDDFINHSSNSSTATRNWDDGSGWISFQNDHNDSTKGSRSKKDRHWEDGDCLEEGRSNKQSSFYADESEPPDMLDKVLLFHYQNPKSDSCSFFQLKGGRGHAGSKGKRTVKKKKDDNTEVVDFQSLLTQCAKAVASYDRRTANEQLKQIRQHSSPYAPTVMEPKE